MTSEPSHRSSADGHLTLIIGGPENNSAAVHALNEPNWPKVSDQGIVLKPFTLDHQPALIIGVSEDLVQDREGYRRALAAANRAIQKTSDRGKSYVQYWIERLKFGIGYINCIEATKALANAKHQLDLAREGADKTEIREKHREAVSCAEDGLQTSVEMLNSLVGVARNQSDRGAIAVMSEYVYRPLRQELRQLQRYHKEQE